MKKNIFNAIVCALLFTGQGSAWYASPKEIEAAERGDAQAQYRVAQSNMHSYSRCSITKYRDEAIKWFLKAAEQGHSESMYELFLYYRKENVSEALAWARKGAEKGNLKCMHELGELLMDKKEEKEGLSWLRTAAELGNISAQSSLAYYAKKRGDRQEYARWTLELAKRDNDTESPLLIGFCYLEGDGVEKDEKEGFKWFCKAAERGNIYALGQIGECYFYGKGVEKDIQKGIKILRLARDKGSVPAAVFLNELHVD